MPSLKRPRTWTNETKYERSKVARKRYASTGVVRQPRFILGKSQRATMRYAERVIVSSAAVQGSIGTYVFSSNGLFDPNNTGIGHQPRGFDQLMALYDHFTVTSAKIKVRFVNNSTSSRPYVGISVRDGNVAMADLEAFGEYGAKTLSNRPLGRISTADEAGLSSSTVLTQSVDVASFLGRKNAMSDPELKGDKTANPTEQVFFHVIVGDPNAASACSVSAYVTIEYETVFHEPKSPTSS